MRKNLKAKAYIYPLPVLIVATFDENGVPDAMNAAWGTVCRGRSLRPAFSLSKGYMVFGWAWRLDAFSAYPSPT